MKQKRHSRRAGKKKNRSCKALELRRLRRPMGNWGRPNAEKGLTWFQEMDTFLVLESRHE